MTRINTVDPQVLWDLNPKFVLAEYRELPRIFTLVKEAVHFRNQAPCHSTSDKYVLGKGHMKFFYTRCGYLLKRQKQLIRFLLHKNYELNHTNPDSLVIGIPDYCMNDWEPDGEAIALNMARLFERMEQINSKGEE